MAPADKQLEALLQTACAFDETGILDVGESIAQQISRPGAVLELLAELSSPAEKTGIEAMLDYQRTLGEGGMGLVRLATQRSLDRSVAVKSVRPELRSDQAAAGLLREAWITGSLEHPNIVPVYDLGVDEDGHPLVVLKRIEGSSWEDLFDDAEAVEARFGATDLLEWNISILLQVINAVRFAHSRGIVHRDLKPDNVMIGEFGEVYVLDWGIAVTTRDSDHSKFRSATDNSQPAGTPGYMAPEMLGGEPITERTDVYLIGAVLYELVTGELPHRADSIDEVIESIRKSEPQLPTTVPPALAAICRRAMAREPDERYPDMDALRVELLQYMTHRESLRLTERAEVRLADLLETIDEQSSPSGTQSGAAVHNIFSECRFGFREALNGWSENTRAREGLERAVVAMVEFELFLGQPRNARLLLGNLSEVPPELAERVEQALATEHAKKERLAKFEQDLDPTVGWRTRNFILLILGIMWVVLPLFERKLRTTSATDNYVLIAGIVIALGFTVIALSVWAWESLSKSAFNRRLTLIANSTSPSLLVLVAGCYLMDFTPDTCMQLSMFLWFVIGLLASLLTSPKLLPMAAGYLVAFLGGAGYPAQVYIFLSAANLLMLVNVGLFSLGRRQPPAPTT